MPTNYSSNVSFSGADRAEADAIERQRRLADALTTKSMQPVQSAHPSAPLSYTQGLAQMMQAYAGKKQGTEADTRAKAMGQQQELRRAADTAMLAQALQGRQAQPAGLAEDAAGNVTQSGGLSAQSPSQSIAAAMPMMRDPQMQGAAFQAQQGALQREEAQRFQGQQAREARTGRAEDARLADQRRQANALELQKQRAADQTGMQQMLMTQRQDLRPPVAVRTKDGTGIEYVPANQAAGRTPANPKGGGQLPASALKIQNDLVEDVGIAGSIKSDLAAMKSQLDMGTLPIGPASNPLQSLRNVSGMSTPESRNYNTFRTSLERMRNESLRLNKGVQTEGDAQRAWAELMGSLNDKKVVGQRLDEIIKLNERAANLKTMQVDLMRSNFNMEPLDTSKFAAPAPAVGGQGELNPQEAAELDALRKRFNRGR